MMTPLDLGLAVAGRLASATQRLVGGSRRAMRAIVVSLLAASAIPTFLIGSSQRPTDLAFDDIRLDRIPAMTSWVRIEGELRAFPGADGNLYELHDTHDDRLYLIVIAPAPLDVGHAIVTGRLSPRPSAVGNIGSIDADGPAVPKRNEPFGLIFLPAAVGGMIALGMRVGYPVVRHQGPSKVPWIPFAQDARPSARWSGRIASEVVEVRDARPCTIAITPGPDLSEVSLTDALGVRTVRVRRTGPQAIRVCRIGGCEPGLKVHAQSADIVLMFGDRETRDRLAVTLG